MKFFSLFALVLGVSSVSQAGFYWGKCNYIGGASNIAVAKAQYDAEMKIINATYSDNTRNNTAIYLQEAVAANNLTPRSRAQEAVKLAIGEYDKRQALHDGYAKSAADASYAKYLAAFEDNTFSCILVK